MPKYSVRYYKTETNLIRCDMTVEAADPAAAVARVAKHWDGEGDLTDEEQNSEYYGKEFTEGCEFSEMEDPEDDCAVREVS